MEFFFSFFKSMYPGTWIWRENKISCTRVHGFEENTKFHVLGYMNWKKNLTYTSRGRGGGPEQKVFLVLDKFFQHAKKILNFWNFVNIEVTPFELNHLGFYCIYSLFWKVRNWNQSWGQIDGTPCNRKLRVFTTILILPRIHP